MNYMLHMLLLQRQLITTRRNHLQSPTYHAPETTNPTLQAERFPRQLQIKLPYACTLYV